MGLRLFATGTSVDFMKKIVLKNRLVGEWQLVEEMFTLYHQCQSLLYLIVNHYDDDDKIAYFTVR